MFHDNFNGTTIDDSKWDIVDSHGSVSQDGKAIFTILGTNSPNSGIHLKSTNIMLPDGTTKLIISGDWWVDDSTYTAEPDIYVINSNDSNKYIRIGYSTWGDKLVFTDTIYGQPINSYSRGHHTNRLPFEIDITKEGWTYKENENTIRSVSSTFLTTGDEYYIKIGGWDYSEVNDQIAYFDNINVKAETPSAVPLPSSLMLCLSGFWCFVFLRDKIL